MALLIGAVDADRRPNGERRMVSDEWWLMANGGNIEPRRWWAVAIRSVRENLCALFALFTVRVAPQSRASCKIRFGRLSLTILLTCPSASKLLWKRLFSRLAYCRSLYMAKRRNEDNHFRFQVCYKLDELYCSSRFGNVLWHGKCLWTFASDLQTYIVLT